MVNREMNHNDSRVLWPEHWTNGGTGYTKFDSGKLPLFERAIRELNDPTVFLAGLELHSTRSRHDLSDFWNIFWRLESQPDNKITPEDYNGAEVFLR